MAIRRRHQNHAEPVPPPEPSRPGAPIPPGTQPGTHYDLNTVQPATGGGTPGEPLPPGTPPASTAGGSPVANAASRTTSAAPDFGSDEGPNLVDDDEGTIETPGSPRDRDRDRQTADGELNPANVGQGMGVTGGEGNPADEVVRTPDGVVEPDRLADPASETAQTVDVKPILGVRLDHYTPEEAVAVDAHERRVYDYNQLAKAEGRPQAVTREEMDRIP